MIKKYIFSKLVLSFILTVGTFGLTAQTVTLTFTARDGANRYLKLNRVVITNLTKSWQETIYWPDTVLTMQNGTGIDDHTLDGGFVLSQNNPNPFSGTTEVSLTTVDEGKVDLDIKDMNGRIIETQNLVSLQPGNHQFRISLSTAGTYVMTARQNGKTSSIKMICNGGGGSNTLDYLGMVQTITVVLKSSTNNPFNFGDQMEYVGYATINGTEEESQRITNTQGSSQSFTLQFSGVQIQYELPTVNTSTVSDITYTSATCGGYVSSDGGATVTARGVCWSTSQNPTTNNTHTADGTGTGSFNSNITGLIGGTTYYVRAYATNSVGTAYGAQRTFTTPADLPTVTTGEISNVTSTTATCGGNVTSTGGVPVTARGLCWSTSQDPTVSGSHTTNGSGTGTFTSNITGLTANTVYFVRAYATNSVGTAYGEQRQFAAAGGGNDGQPCPMATVTDYDGNIYNTVQIGNQCWMKENLKTTHFANGTNIPLGTTSSTPTSSPYRREPYSSGSWPTGFFVNAYGYLYNWAAATYGAYGGIPNIQGACPDGWHLPSDSEWTQLTNYVSCHSQYLCSNNTVNIAKALSSTTGENISGSGWYGWQTNNNYPCSIGNSLNDNNATGFSAMPAGYGYGDLSSYATVYAFFWSSTPYMGEGVNSAYTYRLSSDLAYVVRGHSPLSYYYSIRCLNDNGTVTTLPTVTTSPCNNLTASSVMSGGNITSCGNASITSRGVCWSTSQNPTVSNSHTYDGSGTGSFTSSITGLTANTTYYVRAYATNVVGTAYGNQVSFTTANASLPTVTTNNVTNINYTTATCGGNVTTTGGATVTARGVCWSTSQNPTVSDSHTISGSGAGSFTSSLTGLTTGTTYYVRAYATNSVGTAYGSQKSFTTLSPSSSNGTDGQPCPNAATLTDYDGNTYNTVQIGYQCWMKENLKTTHYSDGTPISLGGSTSTTTAYRYYPDNNSSNVSTYGYLYNWKAVMRNSSSSNVNPSGVQGICPTGWHVPSALEWTQLETYMGTQIQFVCENNNTYIAKALASTTGWSNSSTTCTPGFNPSSNDGAGFSAIAAGYYYSDNYSTLGDQAIMWSSSQYNSSYAYDRSIGYNSAILNKMGYSNFDYALTKSSAVSVRCVKDGDPIDFQVQPCPGISTVTDYDGNTYNTVQIGQQCWMKQNLRTTHYADGTSIPAGGSNTSSTNPYYYNYSSSGIALSSRGYLYNWPAVMRGASSSTANPSGVQGVCPTGWHVPSDSEWTQLTNFVSSQSQYVCGNYNANIAKALASQYYWNNSANSCAVGDNLNINNATGFSAVPAGVCSGSAFEDALVVSDIWTSTLNNNNYAHSIRLLCAATDVGGYFFNRSTGCSVRCLRDDSGSGTASLPTVTTNTVSNITATTATCGGNVTATGGATVTARGVCWSTSQNPTVNNSHTTNGSGTGSFTSSISGLTAGTTYYVRAYATNSAGTAYGSQVSFTTSSSSSFTCGTSTVSDYDGNTYNTVQIGQQCWMKQNLRTTHYSDGSSIPAGGSNTSETNPYYYDFSSSGIALSSRGYLYNWPAVMHGSSSSSANPSGVQGICPNGWHVPSDAEWTQLTDYVSSQSAYVCGSNNTYIAKTLASTTGWNSSTNTCAVGNNQASNNATGFSAVPAGFCEGTSFYFPGYYAYFWSSSLYGNYARFRSLYCDFANVSSGVDLDYSGFSVRCLKD